MSHRPARPFTGRHMAVIMVAFFGVVIAVNLTMATFATRTFGGTVVDNSYVASQKFNGWLEEARAQEQLGWSLDMALDDDRHAVVAATAAGAPLGGARVSATARHPVGRAPDVALAFAEVAPGRFRAVEPLPAGRWKVHMEVTQGASVVRRVVDIL
ncbi:FixH family protein [Sphingosinicella microcystinivorans]|uniref:FixH family protein n=1 Tax=Sphingosinicella microcystinivorans TaxID=335406 RepID=UPI0022F402E4|nr:FixH family protein [Sphingosinicella microcystinivorans]WBX85973.1 FixH family protein [Sphingosinicella microcystinivorans]